MATSASLLTVCLLLSVVLYISSQRQELLPTPPPGYAITPLRSYSGSGYPREEFGIILEDDKSIRNRPRQSILLSFLVGKDKYTTIRRISLALGFIYNFKCASSRMRFSLYPVWTKDGTVISRNTNNNVYVERLNGQYWILYVKFRTAEEEGLYRCADKGRALSINLVIGTDPSLVSAAQYATLKYRERSADPLRCFLSGTFRGNNVNGEWTKSGPGAKYSASQRTLRFNTAITPTHSGTYVYTETTSQGQSSTSITVEVIDLARLPTSIMVMDVTNSSVTIQWTVTDPYIPTSPDTFTVLYGYYSIYQHTRSEDVPSNPTDSTYSVTISSLTPSTQYFFRVQSQTSMADVIHSFVMSFSTLLRGVTNIQVESSTSTGLVVTWDPPNLAGLWPGGATPPAPIFIESYSISIINAETGDIAQETSASGTARSYEFNDLEPGVPYAVTIAPVNSGGQAQSSQLVTFTEELAPRIPPMDVRSERPTPTEVVVSWPPLDLIDARGHVLEYTLTYTDEDGNMKSLTIQSMDVNSGMAMDADNTTLSNRNTAKIEGLHPIMGYIIRIAATTIGGMSDYSTPIGSGIARLPEPRSVRVTSITSSGNVTVEWAVAFPFISKYPGTFILHFGTDQGALAFSSREVPANNPNNRYSVQLQHLAPDTHYYYRISSITDIETAKTGLYKFFTGGTKGGLLAAAGVPLLLLITVAGVILIVLVSLKYSYKHGGCKQTPIAIKFINLIDRLERIVKGDPEHYTPERFRTTSGQEDYIL